VSFSAVPVDGSFVRLRSEVIFKAIGVEGQRIAVESPAPRNTAGRPPSGIESQAEPSSEKRRAKEHTATKNTTRNDYMRRGDPSAWVAASANVAGALCEGSGNLK